LTQRDKRNKDINAVQITSKDRAYLDCSRRKEKYRNNEREMDYCTGLGAAIKKKKMKEEDRPVLINRLVTTLGTSYVKKRGREVRDGGRCDGPAVAW